MVGGLVIRSQKLRSRMNWNKIENERDQRFGEDIFHDESKI